VRGEATSVGSFERFAVPAAFGLLFVMCLHWVHPGTVIAQGDAAPTFDAANILHKLFNPWNAVSEYFGRLTSTFPFALFLALEAILDKLIGASFAQALLLFALLAAALEGVRRLALALGCGPLPSLLAGLLYVLNPFTQITLWTFVTGNIFQAIVPWFLLWIVTALAVGDPKRRRRISLIVVTATVTLVPLVAVTPQLLVEFVLLLGALTMIFVRSLGIRSPGGTVWLLRTAAVAILASLWWFVPELLAFAGVNSGRALSPTDNAWIYGRSSILNVLRHNPAWYWADPSNYPAAPAYDGNVLTYAAGFVPYALMLGALIVCTGRSLRLVRALTLLACACVLVIKGVHEPLGGLDRAVLSLPVAFLFQESGGFSIVALLCTALSAALLFESLRTSATSPWAWPVLGSGAAASAGLAAVLMLSGTVFPDFYTGMPPRYVTVPSFYAAAERYVDTKPGPGGILLLPANESYQSLYAWGYYGTDVFDDVVFRRRVLIPSNPLGYIANSLQSSVGQRAVAMMRDRSPLLGPLLSDIGIRFVVLRGDVISPFRYRIDRATLRAALPRAAVATFGPLVVFDLGSARERTRSASRWIAGSYGNLQGGDLIELNALSGLDAPRVDADVALPGESRPFLYENALNGEAGSGLGVGSQIAVARVPVALVWSGDDARFRGDPAAAVVHSPVRASFSRIPPPVSFPALGIGTGTDSSGAVASLVSVVRPPLAPLNQGAFTLYNPGPQPVRADVRIQVVQRRPTQIVLSGPFGAATDDVAGAVRPVWAEFRSVVVRPGINAMTVAQSALDSRSGVVARDAQPVTDMQSPFVALGSAAPTTWFQRPGTLNASSVIDLPDPNPALVGGWKIDAGWRDDLHVRPEFDPALFAVQGTEATVLVEFLAARRRYVCAGTNGFGGDVSVNDAIYGCLSANGQRVSDADIRALRIGWIGVTMALTAHAPPASGFVGFRVAHVTARTGVTLSPLGTPSIASPQAQVSQAYASGRSTINVIRRAATDRSRPLVGSDVTVSTTSGEIRGTVIVQTGSLVEIVDGEGAHWIPLTSIKQIFEKDTSAARPTDLRLQWRVPFAAGRPLDVHLSVAGATIADPVVDFYQDGVRVSETDLRPNVSRGGAGSALNFDGRLRPALPRSGAGTVELRMQTSASSVSPSSIIVDAFVPSNEPFVPARRDATGAVARAIVESLVRGGATRAPDVANRWPNLSLAEAGVPSGMQAAAAGLTSLDGDWFVWGRTSPNDRIVTLNEQYHPTWICIQPSFTSPIARHYRVDRWRNGWFVAGGVPFVIVNVASLFFLVALVATVLLLAWAWLSFARSGRPRHAAQ
jgi:hypothetical protein